MDILRFHPSVFFRKKGACGHADTQQMHFFNKKIEQNRKVCEKFSDDPQTTAKRPPTDSRTTPERPPNDLRITLITLSIQQSASQDLNLYPSPYHQINQLHCAHCRCISQVFLLGRASAATATVILWTNLSFS